MAEPSAKKQRTALDDVVTVKSYELFKVAPRWLFVRLETNTGVVGWGEPNLEGFSDTVAACVRELMETSVKGEDVTRIQHIYQKVIRQKFYHNGPVILSALSGIDQALWDINGKMLGVPVHRLLGGSVRQRLKVYRWCGGDDNSPAEAAEEARKAIQSSGFKILKMNCSPRMEYVDTSGAIKAAVDRMAAVRKAVGDSIDIGVDFHGRVKWPMAKRLIAALEPYRPLFVEEPVGGADMNCYLPELCRATTVPIATGERMFSLAEFRDLLEKKCVQILQPDCSHVGGISALLNIARLAEAYDVGLAPHCPLGPLALASCLQVDCCAVNFSFQETSMGIHYNSEGGVDLLDYVLNKEDFEVDAEGFVKRLDKPGLGIEIDEEKVRAMAKLGHNWQDREWKLADGTPTTW